MNLLVKNATGIQAVHGAVWLAVAALATGEGIAQSETDIATADDCSQIAVQIPDDASLTREERIALLDKALLESLNNFDPCRDAGAGTGDAAGGSGGGLEGAAGEADGAASEAAGTDSTPVDGIQGDLPPPPDAEIADAAAQETDTIVSDDPEQNPLDATDAGGKLPEDIPPAENDDIIATQFRQAAMAETDPVAKAKLWNEYRRYKNLPEQEVPET